MQVRILLIEDDPLWEDAIVKVISEEGYEIEVARTREEARSMLGLSSNHLSQPRFDLLIVDIKLPSDHEGLEIVEELREKYSKASMPMKERPRVIMSTVLNHVAVSDWEDRARWDEFLVKPYELARLVRRVRSLLKPVLDGSTKSHDGKSTTTRES